MSTLAGWLDAIGAGPDLRDGNCIGKWDIFDDVDLPDEALELCEWCPVLQRCRDWVDRLPAAKRPVGVVGGEVRAS